MGMQITTVRSRKQSTTPQCKDHSPCNSPCSTQRLPNRRTPTQHSLLYSSTRLPRRRPTHHSRTRSLLCNSTPLLQRRPTHHSRMRSLLCSSTPLLQRRPTRHSRTRSLLCSSTPLLQRRPTQHRRTHSLLHRHTSFQPPVQWLPIPTTTSSQGLTRSQWWLVIRISSSGRLLM